MQRYILLAFLSITLQAELLDRIAIAIDHQVVTETHIDDEIRVISFLNRQPPAWSDDERRLAADRLIQQALVAREMRSSRYPPPTEADVQTYLDGLKVNMGDSAAFESGLRKAKLSENILRAHLALQLTTLRFIEYRFRPNFEITDDDVTAYLKRQNKSVSRQAAREMLTAERTDQVLAAWLEESRKQVDIVYLDTRLQ